METMSLREIFFAIPFDLAPAAGGLPPPAANRHGSLTASGRSTVGRRLDLLTAGSPVDRGDL